MWKHAVICALALSLSSSIANAATPKKLNAFPEGERLVYGRVVESFRQNKLNDLVQHRQTLERNYPKSIHLDNAYYMSGMMQFQNGLMGEAIRDFSVVRNRYAKSNKRPAAMFATGVTYQRLGLASQAHRVWQELMKEYPGSPESQRAWMQLKVAKIDSRKR